MQEESGDGSGEERFSESRGIYSGRERLTDLKRGSGVLYNSRYGYQRNTKAVDCGV